MNERWPFGRLATMRDGIARSGWLPWALLALLCLALYLPGIATIPPVDRDEPRFAQASKQMLESGDFLQPRFQNENRFNKPIGIYWLQSAAVLLSGQRGRTAIWAYRLPSVAAALVAVLLTYAVGRPLFGRSTALLGAALLASSALLIVEAHLATTDAALLACVVAAQGCLAGLYVAGRRGRAGSARHAAGFWIAQGLGILIKGPIVPLISALTWGSLALFDQRDAPDVVRSRRDWLAALHWAWGVPLMLIVVLPWAAAVGLATDGTFYRSWIYGDVVSKALGPQESHGAPPGFYLLLLLATFWPGSFAAGLGVLRGWARRQRCGERFCLAWLIPTWLFFEVMPTKLPHYVLPLYPALALLTARAVLAAPAGVSTMWRARVARTGALLWGMVTLAAGAAVVAGSVFLGGGLSVAGAFVFGAAAVTMLSGVWLCWTGQPLRAAWIALAGSIAVFAPVLQWVLPNLNVMWLSRAVSVAVAQQGNGEGSRPLAAVGYHEPSLVFLAGTHIALLDAGSAATFLRDRTDGLVLVSDDEQAAFVRAAAALHVRPRRLWSVDGINYSKGRRTRLHLCDREPEDSPG